MKSLPNMGSRPAGWLTRLEQARAAEGLPVETLAALRRALGCLSVRAARREAEAGSQCQ